MRVAVVGGTGFLGRAVVARLGADGHDVVVLARRGGVAIDVVDPRADVGAALAGCDAVVNLVGIKRATRAQGFAAAHETAVARLIAGCDAAGVRRLVHVSVVGADAGAAGPYMASKGRGEQRVRDSKLDWTIVRPGVIAGAGDDFLTNLAAMLRQMPVFPGPDGGGAEIQPVWVEDVAAAIAAALERPESAGHTVDVVGPERLPLRAWVSRVGAAMGLSTWVVPVPGGLLVPAVAAMERVLAAPPLTGSQLAMLRGGMIGDPGPARALLGLSPGTVSQDRIAAVVAGVPAWLGVSLRIASEGRGPLVGYTAALPRALVLAAAAGLLIAGLRTATPDIWQCMLAADLVLVPAALVVVPLPWRALLRLRLSHVVFGTGAAIVLYTLGGIGAAVLRVAAPALMAPVSTLYAWGDLLPVALALPLLAFIVFAEELFWRAAVGLTAAGRWGPWAGVATSAAAFTLAHLAVGPPVLWLAAAIYGACWAWLAIRTRSVWPGFVCHYLWDVAVMFVAPY